MSVATDPLAAGGASPTSPSQRRPARRRSRWLWVAYAFAAVVTLAVVAEVTDNEGLTAAGTSGAALRLAMPIALAGLGGLWSERSGVVNIGLEGMMILGTWFGAFGGLEFGPWWGVVLGVVGGALGGALHAIATVGFGVDHIVSGVSINLLGLGVARYLNTIKYGETGITQSPRVSGDVGQFDTPFLAGGPILGWDTPDLFGWVQRKEWAVVSDVFSVARGLTAGISLVILLGIALFPLTWWVLWRTPFGLRLRSCGEDPWAAETLGVAVNRMKAIAVIVSGALAGLGGAVLVLVFAGSYQENQTGGRGFIGLAAMIFGNWRPGGLAVGAGLFGFTDALQARDPAAVHALLLFVAIVLAALGVESLIARAVRAGVLSLIGGALFYVWWATTDEIPREFVTISPYIITLLVLVLASQRLRMPAADGIVYRKGEAR